MNLKGPTIFKAHESHIIDLAFTPDSRFLLSAGMDNLVHQWTAGDWSLVQTYAGHEKSVNTVSLTAEGDRFITASSDGRLLLWSIGNSDPIETLLLKGNSARLSRNGDFIAALSSPWVTIMDFEERSVINRLKPFPKRTTALAFHPANQQLAAGGQGDAIRLFDLPSPDLAREINAAHEGFVLSLAFSPDGRYLASTGYEQKLRLWVTDSWNRVGEVRLENQGVQSLAYAPNGKVIGVASDHRLTLLDAISLEILQKIDLEPKGVYCASFSPDGCWLALGSADKRIRLWNLSG